MTTESNGRTALEPVATALGARGVSAVADPEVDLIEVVDIASALSDEDFLRLQVRACASGMLWAAPVASSRRTGFELG